MSGDDIRLAREHVETALASEPGNPEALYLMGLTYLKERNYAEAKTWFNRSLESAPTFEVEIAHQLEASYRNEFNRGNTAMEQGRYETSARHFEAASRIFPDRWEPYPLIGEARKNMGHYRQAQTAFQRCTGVSRLQLFCATNLAFSQFRNGQHQEALATSLRYLELFPGDRNLLKLIAYANLETGDIAAAESYFKRYIASGATYEAVLQFSVDMNNIGEIYVAERFFTLCLQTNPNDKKVLTALSSIYLETGNFDLMVQANERLLSLEPENNAHRKRLLLAYELAGDTQGYKNIQSKLEALP